MPRPTREAIMTALFNQLVNSVKMPFTADTAVNSAVLTNVSAVPGIGLFVGLPVFGPGISRGAVVASLDPLTLSEPAGANAAGVKLTTGFLTFGRRMKHWSQVASQPALFLRDGDEQPEYQGILQKQMMNAEVWMYSSAGKDQDLAPSIVLNNLCDALEAALRPDNAMTRQFTLGGLVQWCRLGKIEKDPGDLDGQAIAVAAIEIIVP